MNELLDKLPSNRRHGSKPRCHWITHGNPQAVSERLTALIAPYGNVSETDQWMPRGFEQTDEAELHKACRLLREGDCTILKDWWFKIVVGGNQKSPNFDIASTCTVTVGEKDRPGLLLVEAKAHDNELRREAGGKRLKKSPSENAKANHDHIGRILRLANRDLADLTGHSWSLSHQMRYQMSNRFAWASKLINLEYPVILVYLGFLNADEMSRNGRPIQSPDEWQKLVRSHGVSVVPDGIWDQTWSKAEKSLVPLIRSVEVPWDEPGGKFTIT